MVVWVLRKYFSFTDPVTEWVAVFTSREKAVDYRDKVMDQLKTSYSPKNAMALFRLEPTDVDPVYEDGT